MGQAYRGKPLDGDPDGETARMGFPSEGRVNWSGPLVEYSLRRLLTGGQVVVKLRQLRDDLTSGQEVV